jgi:hypothetical protein
MPRRGRAPRDAWDERGPLAHAGAPLLSVGAIAALQQLHARYLGVAQALWVRLRDSAAQGSASDVQGYGIAAGSPLSCGEAEQLRDELALEIQRLQRVGQLLEQLHAAASASGRAREGR